jgi:hypothetical protein
MGQKGSKAGGASDIFGDIAKTLGEGAFEEAADGSLAASFAAEDMEDQWLAAEVEGGDEAEEDAEEDLLDDHPPAKLRKR